MRIRTSITIGITLSLILISFGMLTVSEEADSVGPVGTTMFSHGYDYPGGPEGEPVDLLEGNPPGSFDREEGPIKTISIDAEVGIESNSLHIIQDVGLQFRIYDEEGLNGDVIYLDFTTEPESVIFEQVLPGQEYWQNVTFNIDISRFIGSGVNDVTIETRWYVSPGVLGSDGANALVPIEVLPFVDCEMDFDSGVIAGEVQLNGSPEKQLEFDIYNYGNVRYPDIEVEIGGREQAEAGGIEFDTEMEILGERGSYWMEIDAADATPGLSYDIELQLKDRINGTLLGDPLSFDIVIEGETDDPDEPDDPDDPLPEPSIEIDIDDFEYGSYREDGNISCEIIVEGTTSGCSQIVIIIDKADSEPLSYHGYKIDTYDTEGSFKYDGSGCTYHIKEFEDTSLFGDWSSFRLHVYYTIDLEFFEQIWETDSMEVDGSSFPDVGDEMHFTLAALENKFDMEGGNGTWQGITYVVPAQPYSTDGPDPGYLDNSTGSDIDTEGLVRASILLVIFTLIISLIPFVLPIIVIVIVIVVAVKVSSRKKGNQK